MSKTFVVPSDPAWYAVHSKSMQERLCADALLRKGFPAYLPMSTHRVRHARRTRVVSRPLFRRYLFVGLDPAAPAFAEVRKTLGVEWLVTNVDKPVQIRTAIVEEIRRAEEARLFDETRPPDPAPYAVGDEVRIDGFSDRIAQIVAMPSEKRVEVLWKILGQSSSRLTIDVAKLRKVA